MKLRCIAGVVVATVALVAGCGTPEAKEPETLLDGLLTVGMSNDSPGFSTGTTNLAGFDVDLMKAVAGELGLPATPTILTPGKRIGFLKDKRADLVISTFSITKERNTEGIDFAGPYIVTDQALLVRADDKRITDAGSVKGKSVCTIGNTTGSAVDIPGARTDTKKPTTADCVAELDNKGTDAVYNDSLVLYGYTQSNPGRYRVILPGTFGQLQYYGIGILAGHKPDCLKLNKAIQEFLQNRWRSAFMSHFPAAAKAYAGQDINQGDFESRFKPADTDMTHLSCTL